MGRIILALALMLGVSKVLHAQTDVQGDPAIEAVIQSQLDAFKADDFDGAFTFASPTIKGIFGSAANFGAMVQRAYPMAHRSADVRFLELQEIGGMLWQKVLLRDAAGAFHTLAYEMVRGAGDEWQINGVQLLNAPQVGA